MKQQIKNGIIFGLTASMVFTLFGVVYAAWNDTVSNGDTVSASSWNTLIGKIQDVDDNLSFSGGNVGIGTTSPLSALHVTSGTVATSSPNYPAFYIKNDSKTDGILGKTWGILNYGGGLYFNGYGSDSSNLAPGAPVNALFLQDQTGRLGIGTDIPTAKLSVNGGANKSGGGSWSTFSDVRLKDIQGDYTKGLSEILELHPVEFNYKEDNILGWDSEKTYQGLIAQEVQTIFPEAVTQSSNTYLELDTLSIDMALINAIQELKEENDSLKRGIQELNTRVEYLENK